MKAALLFLVAVVVAQQALGGNIRVTTVRGGANLGLLGGKKFPCSQPDPPVATVGWATNKLVFASTGGFTGNTCFDVCGFGYHLAAISSPLPNPPVNRTGPSKPSATTPYLCRFKYTTKATKASTTLYGYYLTGSGNCVAYSSDDKVVVYGSEDAGFECGCCGTINVEGRRWDRGCPAVTALVNSAESCPAGRNWTAPASPAGSPPGTDICTVAPDVTSPGLWGTISPTGNLTSKCFVAPPGEADGSTAAPLSGDFKRFCYKINSYSGPPTPDCKKKNP